MPPAPYINDSFVNMALTTELRHTTNIILILIYQYTANNTSIRLNTAETIRHCNNRSLLPQSLIAFWNLLYSLAY